MAVWVITITILRARNNSPTADARTTTRIASAWRNVFDATSERRSGITAKNALETQLPETEGIRIGIHFRPGSCEMKKVRDGERTHNAGGMRKECRIGPLPPSLGARSDA